MLGTEANNKAVASQQNALDAEQALAKQHSSLTVEGRTFFTWLAFPGVTRGAIFTKGVVDGRWCAYEIQA